MGDTSMRCSGELLDELHELSQRGESYEDVVWRLIDEHRREPEVETAPEPSFEPAEPIEFTHAGEEWVQLDLDLPGQGDLYERRKETILEMANLLRDRGAAEKSDFLELVDPDYVDYKNEDSFWGNCVKGRDSLRAVPGVNKPRYGMSEWTFRDE